MYYSSGLILLFYPFFAVIKLLRLSFDLYEGGLSFLVLLFSRRKQNIIQNQTVSGTIWVEV